MAKEEAEPVRASPSEGVKAATGARRGTLPRFWKEMVSSVSWPAARGPAISPRLIKTAGATEALSDWEAGASGSPAKTAAGQPASTRAASRAAAVRFRYGYFMYFPS